MYAEALLPDDFNVPNSGENVYIKRPFLAERGLLPGAATVTKQPQRRGTKVGNSAANH